MNVNEVARLVSVMQDWPAEDRIVLARKILETVERGERSRGLKGEEVIRMLQMPQHAFDDDRCDDIVAEELMRKYGV